MRAVLALAFILPLPAYAWEATVGAVCTLSHATPEATVLLTYDPALPRYTITFTRPGAPWPEAPLFALRFDGPQPNTIQTDRHSLSEGNTALSVTDRGFGNVLDGLQFNDTATALSGDQALRVPLDGAGPAVATFRACVGTPTA